MKFLCVVPARFASKRFPGKVLVSIGGKPMLQCVAESCCKAGCFEKVLIATDSRKIVHAASQWKLPAVMTSRSCRNGTERVAEVAKKEKADYYINVQADQPDLPPELLKRFCAWLERKKPAVGTVVVPLKEEESQKPSVVKAVLGFNGLCVFFSRLPVPYSRDGGKVRRYKHLGIYAYSAKILPEYPKLPIPEMEKAEKLEQLRFLASGIAIHALKARYDIQAVDTASDLKQWAKGRTRH